MPIDWPLCTNDGLQDGRTPSANRVGKLASGLFTLYISYTSTQSTPVGADAEVLLKRVGLGEQFANPPARESIQ